MSRTFTTAFIAAALFASSASAGWYNSDDGSAAYGIIIHPRTESVSGVGLSFFQTHEPCDSVLLMPMEFGAESIALQVDGERFRSSGMRHYGGRSFIVLSDAALAALKHGTYGVVYFDEIPFFLDLTGSAKAINKAWRSCERGSTRSKPALPSKPDHWLGV